MEGCRLNVTCELKSESSPFAGRIRARMHNLRRRLTVSKIDRCRFSFKFALITDSRDPNLTPAMLVMMSLRSWLPL